ncbi:MAG: arginine--tRNA ligase [Planctomycetes bacterium]|nr:arginine--tRNA ligase [Planctomycetota bacterium]
MMDLVRTVAEALAGAAGLPCEDLEGLLEVPRDEALGDYALPCFTLARRLRKAPPAIASSLARAFRPTALVREARAVGPYLNLRLDAAAVAAVVLPAVLEAGEDYGGSREGAGRTVVVDYSSPNIAKPFGIGHLRSTVIGAALCRIHRRLGWRVVGVNHLGDWGTQFGLLNVARERYGREPPPGVDPLHHLLGLYVRIHREAEADPSVAEAGRAWFRGLEAGEPARLAAWRECVATSVAEFDRIYRLLGVDFEETRGESSYNDRLEAAVQRVREAGLLATSEGAQVVDLAAHVERLGGGEPPIEEPILLRKADGATLYATRDLAAVLYRAEVHRFERCLYVVGAPQALHFRQLFALARLLGVPGSEGLVHVAFGHYLGMRTREGSIVFLEEVLEEAERRSAETMRASGKFASLYAELPGEELEAIARAVGVGAVVFNDLKNRRIKDVEFDWDRILAFDGETGPYLQYTHARLASILRRAGEGPPREAAWGECADERVAPVVRRIAGLPAAVRRAAADHEPSIVAGYLLDLAQSWNRVERQEGMKVIDAPPARRGALLAVVAALRMTLASGLSLLGVRPLARM